MQEQRATRMEEVNVMLIADKEVRKIVRHRLSAHIAQLLQAQLADAQAAQQELERAVAEQEVL